MDQPNDRSRNALRRLTRRHFFEQASFGIGGLALASLFDRAVAAQEPARTATGLTLQYPPKAKRVIYLFMAGAPSQLDLFDPKPALTKHDGEDIPAELIEGERFAFIKGTPKLLGVALPVLAPRTVGRRDLGTAAAPGERWRMTSPSSARCAPTSSITPRRRSS